MHCMAGLEAATSSDVYIGDTPAGGHQGQGVPPTLGFNWGVAAELSALELREGTGSGPRRRGRRGRPDGPGGVGDHLGAGCGPGPGRRVLFGLALQKALAPEGVEVLVVPIGQLVFCVMVAAVAGVVAAVAGVVAAVAGVVAAVAGVVAPCGPRGARRG